MTARALSEQQIHIAIVAYLRRVLPQPHIIVHARNEGNRGGQRGAIDGARGKAMGVQAGWPDLEVVVGGRHHMIEVKQPGKNLSRAQRLVAADLDAQGIPNAVCRSVDDVRAVLAAWGVKTREKALRPLREDQKRTE